MTIRAYESLIESPPGKIYLGARLGYLLPYFRREKCLQEISIETGIPERTLANWLRNDLSLIEDAFVKQEQAYAELSEQAEPLGVPEGGSKLTVVEFLKNGPLYQDAFLGYISHDQLAEELSMSLHDTQLILESLYGKAHAVFEVKSAIFDQYFEIKGRARGGPPW